MAATFNDIVQRVRQQLLGFTRDQASISYLVQPMTSTDMSFSVDTSTVTNLSRGITEIDDELMLVKSYDKNSGIVTLFGNSVTGRGVEATTAASHLSGAIVTADPRYPKQRIKEAINDSINGVYPDLWTFGEYEFNYTAARYEYPIPAEAEGVYKVVINTIGPSGVWFPLTSWRFNAMASTGSQVKPTPPPTGKSIQLMRDAIVPGRAVRVSYTKKPNILVNGTDDFEAVTGFPERYIDLITYGACWRMLPSYEAGRLQQQSIESTERAPLVPTGAASGASQYFLGLYQRRLNEEQDRLLQLFETYQTFQS